MFPSKIASERGLTKLPRSPRFSLTSFETQKGHLLARLEQSLADAKGRYVEGKSYSQAKPSKNWRVTKEADRSEDEVVTVYLQVGKRLVDSAGPDGVGKKHKLPATWYLGLRSNLRTSALSRTTVARLPSGLGTR